MRRREFIALASGAVAWPSAAHAQEQERVRRIGVLMGYAEDDPEAQLRLAAFTQALAALGWTEGRNLRIDIRWSAGDVDRASRFAKELVALQPEVILSNTTPVTTALLRETHIIPIVFLVVSDPIGSGFVESLAQPGGNVTGFINLEASLVEKWLQLLKEIAPSVTRVAVMFNPDTAPYADYYLQPLHTVAPVLGVKPFTAAVRSEAQIEEVISGLAREAGGGLMVMTDSFMTVHRKSIVALTARNKVPAVSFITPMTAEGGLISYGVNIVDLFQRAASYIDRILRGAKPADLPVQVPTRFELAINLETAKALGLTIPPSLLARADMVIE
jgi:putative tryptophan/tyrosine transport system substrate-binding protein